MITIEFNSTEFHPYLPEDCQVNPGAYGFELALWLSQTLMAKGIITGYPVSEDWGWFIEYVETDNEFMIGCSSLAECGEGYKTNALAWRVFIKQYLPWHDWQKKHAKPEITRQLADAIIEALTENGIHITNRH